MQKQKKKTRNTYTLYRKINKKTNLFIQFFKKFSRSKIINTKKQKKTQ